MKPIYLVAVMASVSGCATSGSPRAQYAKSACALAGHPLGDPGYMDCFNRMYPEVSSSTTASNGGADNPVWGQMIGIGAQMMQGPPKPQVTTTTCNAVGGTAFCTSVKQ